MQHSRHASRSLHAAVAVCAAIVGVGACSSPRPAVLPRPVSTCAVGSTSLSARDTVSVAVLGSIEPIDAPVPANDAERFAFAQVYETLLDVDCDRVARPALAASWSLDATRTRVTLVLRDGAQFSDGKVVTTANVLAAWTATGARLTPAGRLASQLAAGTTIIDEHTLIVSLPDSAWLVLADPALAVYEPRLGDGWPAGTGPFRVVEGATNAPSAPLVLTPAAPSSPYLIARPVPSGDPRDAIDASADALVTGHPAAASYAAARANLVIVSLPFTRTYALALPAPTLAIARPLLLPDSQSVVLRASLARDAVRAQARGAHPPSWWDVAPGCTPSVSSSMSPREQRSNRIVYRRDDVVARGLAERLVALDARAVAAALPPNDFARALHDGGDLAYVLDLPFAPLSPCDDLRDLLLVAPWLAVDAGGSTRLVPLIDTRETAIVNRQRVSATVDWRGTLRFGAAHSQP